MYLIVSVLRLGVDRSTVSNTLTAKASDSLYSISIFETLNLVCNSVKLQGNGNFKPILSMSFSNHSKIVLVYASISSW